jgi:O-antigen/teichoic acid export membrane protein
MHSAGNYITYNVGLNALMHICSQQPTTTITTSGSHTNPTDAVSTGRPLRRFGLHYKNYVISIIIPAVINGLSIPLLKNWLGAAAYGQYALYFNAMLITNLGLSTWLSQSVLRFRIVATDKPRFDQQALQMAGTIGIGALPLVAFIIGWWSGNWLVGLLFGLLLWLATIQLVLQSLIQASFLSRQAIYAEAIRMISWLISSTLLLWIGLPFLPALLAALLFSYLLCSGYLYRKVGMKLWFPMKYQVDKKLFQQLFRYGWPLSVWFLLYYMSGYVDKLYTLRKFGPEVQGHYSALYDFTARSLILLLAPVLTAVTPLLAETFEKGQQTTIWPLLCRIMIIEAIGLVLIIGLYMTFGYKLLFAFLRIPPVETYYYNGLLFIIGTLLWQLGLLLQKPLELKQKTGLLLISIIGSIGVQLVLYCLFSRYAGPQLYPSGYCLAACCYLVIIALCLFRLSKKPAPGSAAG